MLHIILDNFLSPEYESGIFFFENRYWSIDFRPIDIIVFIDFF